LGLELSNMGLYGKCRGSLRLLQGIYEGRRATLH